MVDVTVTDSALGLVNSVVPTPLDDYLEDLNLTYTHFPREHVSSPEQQPDPQHTLPAAQQIFPSTQQFPQLGQKSTLLPKQ